MKPHQQRVLDEERELTARFEALDLFIEAHPVFRTLDQFEQARLRRQRTAMSLYRDVLLERICAFRPH
jgi:hypothetical protein